MINIKLLLYILKIKFKLIFNFFIEKFANVLYFCFLKIVFFKKIFFKFVYYIDSLVFINISMHFLLNAFSLLFKFVYYINLNSLVFINISMHFLLNALSLFFKFLLKLNNRKSFVLFCKLILIKFYLFIYKELQFVKIEFKAAIKPIITKPVVLYLIKVISYLIKPVVLYLIKVISYLIKVVILYLIKVILYLIKVILYLIKVILYLIKVILYLIKKYLLNLKRKILILKIKNLSLEKISAITINEIKKVDYLYLKTLAIDLKVLLYSYTQKYWTSIKWFSYHILFYEVFFEIYYIFLDLIDVEKFVGSYLNARKDHFINDWRVTIKKWKEKWKAEKIQTKKDFIETYTAFITFCINSKATAKEYLKGFLFIYSFIVSIFVRKSFIVNFLFIFAFILIIKFLKILFIFILLNYLKFKIFYLPVHVLVNLYRKIKWRIIISFRHVYLRIFRHFTLKWFIFYSKKYRNFFVACGFRFRYKRLLKGELFIHYSLWDKWKNPVTDNFFCKLLRRHYKWWYKKYRLHRMSIKFKKKFKFYKFFGINIEMCKKLILKLSKPIIILCNFIYIIVKSIINHIRKK